jgi:hypothetical protein
MRLPSGEMACGDINRFATFLLLESPSTYVQVGNRGHALGQELSALAVTAPVRTEWSFTYAIMVKGAAMA